MRFTAVLLYLAVGFCAAAWRAYREPMMARRYYANRGWLNIYDEKSTTTFEYPGVLFLYVAFWPITLSIMLLGEAFSTVRDLGVNAMRARIVRERQAQIDAAEIDRIISEAKL